MAVQLLENWLLKEQEKIQTKYRHLNHISVVEPNILFIGDSIVEYYPLQELFGTSKTIVNRGIRGYQTGLLLENLDAHLYGGAVDKIFLLNWNQAYQELASAYMQVEFLPVFDCLTDQAGQLKKEYTTDGLHLSIAGYQALSKALKDYLY